MLVQANGEQGQGPAAGDPLEGQEPPATPPDGQEPEAGKDETFTREYVAQLRRENAEHRRKAQEATQAAEEARLAALPEAERLQSANAALTTETETLRNEVRDLKASGAVIAAAAAAHDPALVYSLIRDEVELGADGKPSNHLVLIAALRKERPYLFRRAEANAGAGAGPEDSPTPGVGINDMIRNRR